MAEAGHQVELISGWNNNWEETKVVNGFTVHYLPVAYGNQLGNRQRKFSFLNYIKKAKGKIDSLGRFDLAYVSSTPLTIGLLALYLKWIKKTPYIFEIRDLWPEAPWQLGAITNRWIYRALKILEKTLYRQARGVVALSPPMAEAIKKLATRQKVLIAPNMADVAYFSQPASEPLPVNPAELEGKFIVSYTGTAGPANGLDALLKVAEYCQAEGLPVYFLLMAEGKELPKLKASAEGLKNLQFLPYGNKEQAKACVQLSDAVYISFADYPVLQSCSPNKLFDGLAAGKLIITNTPGWMQELVESNNCGFYASGRSAEEFIQKLRPFLEDRNRLKDAQENAKMLATEHFSKEKICKAIIDFLESEDH
jgi:glycosyltransferase involved in cell wall biosynthesis